jgi:OHCU decarboxylase
MNPTLSAWNSADADEGITAMLACCGCKRWAVAMVAARPILTIAELSLAADQIWATMEVADWMEAFAHHPRIGERSAALASKESLARSSREQASIHSADVRVLAAIAAGNAQYEQIFGFTYIVCATGKSAEEMLAILNRRLRSDRETELRAAAEQQRQITQIRLGKWAAE